MAPTSRTSTLAQAPHTADPDPTPPPHTPTLHQVTRKQLADLDAISATSRGAEGGATAALEKMCASLEERAARPLGRRRHPPECAGATHG